MSQQIAHNIESTSRTQDISIRDNVDFTAMLLSDRVLHGLQKNGFKKPSPIQLKAIPMGRCGFDLIIKAKSGTGKTAVFGIVALEMVNVKSSDLQILILAPTREIAVQIQQVLLTIGTEINGLKIEYFIGGTKLDDDTSKLKNCHIAVGAPGRVKHLIKKGAMKLDSVRLFVLDEADKLMQSSYQADINFIYNNLGPRKQIIASSATYPDELDTFLAKYMTSPTHISPDIEVPVLLGIKQFVSIVSPHLNVIQQMALKTDELVRILQTISFTQCVIFSNYQTRAESLSNNLKRLGWPAIHISAAQKQKDRLEAVDRLKEFKCRILSTTDLTARGIDAANVDLVINYEVPYEAETYLHRMGRAGRYGSYGICITIATAGIEVEKLQKIIANIGDGSLSLAKYPKTENLPADIWKCNVKCFEQLHANVERNDTSGTNESKGEDSQLKVKKETDLYDCRAQPELKTTRDQVESSELSSSKTDVQCSEVLLPFNETKLEMHTESVQQSESTLTEKQVHLASNQPSTSEITAPFNEQLSDADIICKGDIETIHGCIYDGIKNDIVRVVAGDNQTGMVDFVEEMLSNLNKEQELIQTKLNREFRNVDARVFETLVRKMDQLDGDLENVMNVPTDTAVTRKPLNEQLRKFSDQTISEDMGSMNSVEKILENISNREEMSKMKMKDKLADLDSSSILDMLSKGVQFDAIRDENIDKSECKKAKVNETIQCDKGEYASSVEPVNNENEQFENEAKMFQENNIVNKNIALYNLTSLLVDDQQKVNDDCVTSVEHLLNIIQAEDTADKSNIDLQTALSDVLSIRSGSDRNVTDNDGTHGNCDGEIDTNKMVNLNTNQDTINENISGQVQCGCSENIFSDMYTFAITESDQNWTSSLCQKHAGATNEMNENYGVEESEEMFDEDGYYGEEEYANNEQTYCNAYSTEENPAEAECNKSYDMEEIKTEYDEELFVKAYEYALISETEENQVECNENTESTLTEYMDSAEMPEACGYAAGYSYKNFSCKKPNKRKHTNYEHKMAECMNDTSYTSENYESHYEYFDTLLADSAPMFNNVQRFERFFKKWQENVYSVRNYIQHDVYVKERLCEHK